MVTRIWHGWTNHENADKYEKLLKTEIFPGIASKNINGYLGIQLYRSVIENSDEVEFMTIMRFDSLDSIKAFTGENYEIAYVPQKAREILKRFDQRAKHYEILHELTYS